MFSRPPPPQGGPPPTYAFVNRVYRRSLRPVILGTTFVAALWSLLWGIAAFRDISIDKQHATKLAVFDIVLGALYMATCAVELLGMAGAAFQRIFLVRIYSFLSLGVALIITATELIRVIVHFAFKSDLISECTALVTGDTIDERFGLWGPIDSQTLSPEDASNFCNSAWSHDSFSEILWLLIAAPFSLFFAAVSFAYYRQLLDPTSPANAARAPSAQARGGLGGGFPQHYNPPYAAGAGPYGGGDGTFAPPPGPPPGAESSAYVPEYDPAKLPGYGYSQAVHVGKDGKDAAEDPFADFEANKGPGPAGERF